MIKLQLTSYISVLHFSRNLCVQLFGKGIILFVFNAWSFWAVFSFHCALNRKYPKITTENGAMGSKKHKKHKSERREKYEDRQFCLERPPSLKLILKVSGNSSTPEHGSDSPTPYGIQSDTIDLSSDYPERYKKSKKKKKKKDREKRHKHHHKEKRHPRDDSSQEDISMGEDSSQLVIENIQRYATLTTLNSLAHSPVTKPMHPLKSPTPDVTNSPHGDPLHDAALNVPNAATDSISMDRSPSVNTLKSSSDYLKSPSSDCSVGREPRTCVLKMKQSKSPLSKLLDHLLRSLEKKDPHQFFAWPVTDDIAPGYSSIISEPMDFLTIRQKVDENEYGTMQEFHDDFRLMCDNAIKYNHPDTVYHKAAKRLLHIGMKMLLPDQLVRSLRPLMMYMKLLTPKELGFDLMQSDGQDHDSHIGGDSADEGASSTGADELNAGHTEEAEKRRLLRQENKPKSRFEAYVDDMTAEEVLCQVQSASKLAKKKVLHKKTHTNMGFLRQNKDGTTSMKIIVDTENVCPERVISLGAFTGKLHQGTGQLQGFREDRRNTAKIVKPILYGSFSSFAPIFDSRFSNLTKDESELILSTYDNEMGTEYAGSIMEFSKDSNYATTLANSLLDILTNGEHRKTIAVLTENHTQRQELAHIEQSFPSSTVASSKSESSVTATSVEQDGTKTYENIKIDFGSLRTLADIGVDTTFLHEMEDHFKTIELHKKLQQQLLSNSTLIERLQQVQHERLSQPLPVHLAHVPHPNTDEIELAAQITTNLTEMAKQLPPDSITTPHALRKAMGISNVGLEPIVTINGIVINSIDNCKINNEGNEGRATTGTNSGDIDTTSVPMELELDDRQTSAVIATTATAVTTANTSASTGQVDLESELREFFEGPNTLGQTDDVDGIEQMLMD